MQNSLLKNILINRWSAFVHDLLWIPVTLLVAYLLRFNFEGIPQEHVNVIFLLVATSIPIQGLAYWMFGMYRGLWRFASIPDLLRILKAVVFGALCITFIISMATRLSGVPRSVLFLYPILLSGFLSIPRLLYRWYKDRYFSLQKQNGKRVVIIGAGNAGQLLLRDLRHRNEYQPVGFLDDDPTKQRREIHGIPILGKIEELPKMAGIFQVQELIIAIPSATRKEMREIVRSCGESGVPASILPTLSGNHDDQVSGSQLQPLSINDLLGRETVQLDNEAIEDYLMGKNVLVTGGGGSIGSELCRQIAGMKPSRLIIFDHGEFNLYAIDHELRQSFPDLELVTFLGDVKNQDRVNWMFNKFSPEVVFHAAAYKHVPMLEINPAEGVSNNVAGTRTIVDAADRFGVSRFVQVSTDKAVNPTNVMGTTKRIGELYCQNLNGRSNTKFITTRFGNVLGSTGSVVPLFQRQIEEGGPVTVTHKEVTRYFMTIPESVSLILQAGAMGRGGEIFVLNMGEPICIKDLAEQMITLSGLRIDEDIKIVYTGLRPGEKLFEEVLHESEDLQKTTHEKLLLANSRQVDWEWLNQELDKLQQAATSRDVDLLKEHLQNLVPEYQG